MCCDLTNFCTKFSFIPEFDPNAFRHTNPHAHSIQTNTRGVQTYSADVAISFWTKAMENQPELVAHIRIANLTNLCAGIFSLSSVASSSSSWCLSALALFPCIFVFLNLYKCNTFFLCVCSVHCEREYQQRRSPVVNKSTSTMRKR